MGYHYTFCETNAAYLWHIRRLTEAGRKLGGGADTRTLCGLQPSWDVNCVITETSLSGGRFGAGAVCPKCAERYRDRAPREL